ncbi:MAG: Fur family transcriptional regulator [Nocardioides sp.]|nr:Fur family transcriptional regulator [Nocardioides sp.]
MTQHHTPEPAVTTPAGSPPLRDTRQRRAVAAALDASDEFRSAQDLHQLVRDSGERVGLATVYRALQAMVDAGEVDVVRSEAGEAQYRRCDVAHHHHHLICRGCGKAVEVEGPAFEEWADAVARQHGFVDVRHTLELTGTCADCRRAGGAG